MTNGIFELLIPNHRTWMKKYSLLVFVFRQWCTYHCRWDGCVHRLRRPSCSSSFDRPVNERHPVGNPRHHPGRGDRCFPSKCSSARSKESDDRLPECAFCYPYYSGDFQSLWRASTCSSRRSSFVCVCRASRWCSDRRRHDNQAGSTCTWPGGRLSWPRNHWHGLSYLTPAFLMSNLRLVFDVGNEKVPSGQHPRQSSAVGCGCFQGWGNFHRTLMNRPGSSWERRWRRRRAKRRDSRGCSIDDAQELLDEFIRHLFVVLVFFGGIIEEDMSFVLVVVQVFQVQVIASGSTRTLIAVQSERSDEVVQRDPSFLLPHDRLQQL